MSRPDGSFEPLPVARSEVPPDRRIANSVSVARFDSDLLPPVDPVEPVRRMPNRGNRKRVLGDGEGDFCIYVIADGSTDLPAGALVPIDGIPRFTSATEAKRWMQTSSGDLLVNKQVMIFKAYEIINIVARVKTNVELQAKTKINVSMNRQEEP